MQRLLREPVVARVPQHPHAARFDPIGAPQALGRGHGSCHVHPHPARAGAVHAQQDRPRERGPTHRGGHRRIEVQLLERRAVTQVDDACAAHPEAIDISEPVRDDRVSRPECDPEARPTAAENGFEALRGGDGCLGIIRDRPKDLGLGILVTQFAREHQRALSDPDAATKYPLLAIARHHERQQHAEQIHRSREQLREVCPHETELAVSTHHSSVSSTTVASRCSPFRL